MEKWQKLSSEYALKERWITVRRESFRTPAGDVLDPYYLLEYPDWIVCVAIDQDLNVIVLNHYRPGADGFLHEMPAGHVEPSDSNPAMAARREIKEEIGYEGGELFATGACYSNPANQTNRTHNFLALGGRITSRTNHQVGETMSIFKMTLPELIADLSRPAATPRYQGLHLAAIFQAINFIKQSDHPDAIKLRQQLQ